MKIRINYALMATMMAGLIVSPTITKAENPYDLIGRALIPLADLLSKDPKREARAMHADILVKARSSTDGAPHDAEVMLFMQVPDKLRADALVGKKRITVCRNGQKVWAWPASEVKAYLDMVKASGKKDPNARLADFTIPVTSQQVAFLPALLKVKDRGYDTVGKTQCRKLDLAVMPELAEGAGMQDWRATAWIDPKSGTFRRIDANSSIWNGSMVIRNMKYHRMIKGNAWEPTAPMKKDVIELSGAEFMHLLNAFSAQSGF